MSTPTRQFESRTKQTRPARDRAVPTLTSQKGFGHVSPARLDVLLGLALVAITFLAYALACGHGYIWDDQQLVYGNRLVRSADGWWRLWTDTNQPEYLPLSSLTFWCEFHLWGDRIIGYHITNVAFHALSGVLLWRILKRLAVPGAWLAAVLFAVHPVGVGTVAWIAERKNVTSLALMLATFLCYLEFERTLRPRWYVGSIALFAAALLCKTSVVMFPVVLLIYAWWRYGAFRLGDVKRSLPYFGLSFVLGLVTVYYQVEVAIGGGYIPPLTIPGRIALMGCAFWFYVYKLLVPIHLAVVYPIWNDLGRSAISFLPDVAMVGLFVVSWHFRKTWGRHALFGFGYFFFMLLPVLGLMKMSYWIHSRVSDHLQYAAMLGVIVPGVAAGVSFFNADGKPARRRLGLVVAVLFTTGLGGLTLYRGWLFNHPNLLWADTLNENPNAWVAYNYFGIYFLGKNDLPDAREQFQLAINAMPDTHLPHVNLGATLEKLGLHEEALHQYQLALKLYPQYWSANFNIGNLMLRQQKYDQAIAYYQKALPYADDSSELHHNLAIAYARSGHPELGAIPQLMRAADLDPKNPTIFTDLGMALYRAKNDPGAEIVLRHALELNPRQPYAHAYLARALDAQGRAAEAQEQRKMVDPAEAPIPP